MAELDEAQPQREIDADGDQPIDKDITQKIVFRKSTMAFKTLTATPSCARHSHPPGKQMMFAAPFMCAVFGMMYGDIVAWDEQRRNRAAVSGGKSFGFSCPLPRLIASPVYRSIRSRVIRIAPSSLKVIKHETRNH